MASESAALYEECGVAVPAHLLASTPGIPSTWSPCTPASEREVFADVPVAKAVPPLPSYGGASSSPYQPWQPDTGGSSSSYHPWQPYGSGSSSSHQPLQPQPPWQPQQPQKQHPQQQVRHPEKRERVDATQASPNPRPKKITQVDAASRVNNHMCKIGTVQVQETLVDPTVGMWQCKVTIHVMATSEVFTIVSTDIGKKAAKRTAFEDAALRLNV